MTDIRVARRYTFQAQHHIPGLGAPWNKPHWHDYTVEVVAASDTQLLLDTDRLDEAWDQVRPIFESFTDSNLNELYADTTVEALAVRWFDALRELVGDSVREVTVWEDTVRWGRVTA